MPILTNRSKFPAIRSEVLSEVEVRDRKGVPIFKNLDGIALTAAQLVSESFQVRNLFLRPIPRADCDVLAVQTNGGREVTVGTIKFITKDRCSREVLFDIDDRLPSV